MPDQPVSDKNLVERSIIERISVKSWICFCSAFIKCTLRFKVSKNLFRSTKKLKKIETKKTPQIVYGVFKIFDSDAIAYRHPCWLNSMQRHSKACPLPSPPPESASTIFQPHLTQGFSQRRKAFRRLRFHNVQPFAKRQ